LEAEFEKHDGYLLARIKGDVRLWGRSDVEKDVLERFRNSVAEDTKHLVLNLSRISYLDTMGIAAMVRILIECSKRKLELKLVLPGGVPGESLRRVRIFEPWPSYHDEAAAVRALSA